MAVSSTSSATGPKRSEQIIAWLANVVGCLYCAWMGFYQWRNTGIFGGMFEGLGAQLPTSTRFVVEHRG